MEVAGVTSILRPLKYRGKTMRTYVRTFIVTYLVFAAAIGWQFLMNDFIIYPLMDKLTGNPLVGHLVGLVVSIATGFAAGTWIARKDL